MKVIIVALAFVAIAAAAAIDGEPASIIPILRSVSEQNPDGGYSFSFETENKISRSETGELKTVQNEKNEPQAVVVVRGSWSYADPEGNLQAVNYYADESGYHADGPSVPKVASRR